MSITNDNTENLFTGNGVTTVFPTNISAFDSDQILVYIREDGVDTLKMLSTHYTLSGFKPVGSNDDSDAAVSVTMLVAPTAEQEVVVVRSTDKTQELALTSSRAYNPEVLMQQLDLIVMMMQELASETARAFKVLPGSPPATEVADGDALVTVVDSVALAVSSAAAAAASAATALEKENSMLRGRGAWVTATAYSPSDIVRVSGTAYICIVAHTSGTFATDLAAVKWEVFVSKGDPGDVQNSDNLSGLTDKPQAILNLGFSTLGRMRGKGTAETVTPGADSQGSVTLAATTTFAVTNSIAVTSAITVPALVSGEAGRMITIMAGISTAVLKVYPALGQSFEGKPVNTPLYLMPKSKLTLWQRDNVIWNYQITEQETSDLFYRTLVNVGANVTTVQNILLADISLEQGTYEYELGARFDKSAGATSHNFSVGFGGTAVVLGRRSMNYSFNSSTVGMNSINNFGQQNILTAIAIAAAAISHEEKGFIAVTTEGTFIPQYQLSAAPGGAYTVQTWSYMRLKKFTQDTAGAKGVWV